MHKDHPRNTWREPSGQRRERTAIAGSTRDVNYRNAGWYLIAGPEPEPERQEPDGPPAELESTTTVAEPERQEPDGPPAELESTTTVAEPEPEPERQEPEPAELLFAVSHVGGGTYAIIGPDGEVDRVRGKEQAEARASSLEQEHDREQSA
jgi:hypothetical protein